MKFLIDIPLSITLARWLAEAGHDALHAYDLGLERAADIDIIKRARQDQRTVITADLDYPRLLALSDASEPSLILESVVAFIHSRRRWNFTGRYRYSVCSRTSVEVLVVFIEGGAMGAWS